MGNVNFKQNEDKPPETINQNETAQVTISLNNKPPETIDVDISTSKFHKDEAKNKSFRTSIKDNAQDHFSLSHPSSTVFINKKVSQIFPHANFQYLLQRDGDRVLVKKCKDGSIGLLVLRAIYALISLLMTGFLFVFCMQIIFFLFLGLTIESGRELEGGSYDMFYTLLSIPVFVYGLASFMAIATAFVNDIWCGNKFMNTIGGWNDVKVGWTNFVIFIAIPFVTGSITLFMGSDRWWEITSMTWISCVFFYFMIFAIAVVFFEINGCLELMRYSPRYFDNGINEQYALDKEGLLSWDVLRRAIYIRQRQKFSPTKEMRYVSCTIVDEGGEEKYERENEVTIIGMYSKLTLLSCLSSIFVPLDKPQEIYNIDDIRHTVPIETSQTWTLGKLYFLGRDRPRISVLSGSSALTPRQILSTFTCSIIGVILPIVLIAAMLTFLGLPAGLIAFTGVIIALCFYQSLRNSAYIFRMLKVSKEKPEKDMCQVRKVYRVADASKKFCWVMLVIEELLFFLIPMFGLFLTKNFQIASIFLVTAIISLVRQFVSISMILKELGSMDGVEINNKNEQETWAEKQRLSLIVGKISQGRRRNLWINVFYSFVIIFAALFSLVVVSEFDPGGDDDYDGLTDFHYPGKAGLAYPTCKFGMDTIPESKSPLIDFVFLSSWAYQKTEMSQDMLDNWFGKGVAIDLQNNVNEFQTNYREINGISAAKFKLVQFPANNSTVVAIRGTRGARDALADVQLWMSAFLAQMIRVLMPFGQIWNPAIRHLINIVSAIEADSLKSISYYKEISVFVEELKKDIENVVITGHSLGGGLALITGGQTHTQAIAVSGTNNMLSRDTFEPNLTVEEIGKYMFNIVPEGDIVPMIDDKGPNYQLIQCTASLNDPFGCHLPDRTLCDLMYTCGSFARPVLCRCHDLFGYPKPEAIGNRLYEDACPPQASSQG